VSTVIDIETMAKELEESRKCGRKRVEQEPQQRAPREPEWPKLDPAAYHGLAGDIVQAIAPHTEADPVAILVQTLVAAGNVIGNGPYYQVEGDRHRANLFANLVGDSAKARKGTAWGRVKGLVRQIDEQWFSDRTKSGLSSGEGLIFEVRDEIKRWDSKEKRHEVVDPGIADKRLLVIEPEFAGVLSAVDRHGNTLSPLIRRSWDGDNLSSMTKNTALCATAPHVSIIGHITIEELRARLTRTDSANGFANRFLFPLVRRSQVLPFGGETLRPEVVDELGAALRSAVAIAKKIGPLGWTMAGVRAWKKIYEQLSAGKPGLLGAVTARAEAQCVRLALVYALLDGSSNLDLPHIEAALALWEYCEASAAHIFGESLGDPIADEILRALQRSPEGLSRTGISNLFGRNQGTDRIGAALGLLMRQGKASMDDKETEGRSAEVWFAVGALHG
jgi:hypothetical protein